MQTILVSGGAGYIGSHTVQALIKREFKAVVVDSLVTGHRGAVAEQADSPRRKGDPDILVAKVEKIEKALGWGARNCDLETIISTAWKWHQGITRV